MAALGHWRTFDYPEITRLNGRFWGEVDAPTAILAKSSRLLELLYNFIFSPNTIAYRNNKPR